MTKSVAVFSIILSALLFCASSSGNYAFAKQSVNETPQQKKTFAENSRALAEEMRKKALEKLAQDYKTKQDDLKKQLALDAKKKQDDLKKQISLVTQKKQDLKLKIGSN